MTPPLFLQTLAALFLAAGAASASAALVVLYVKARSGVERLGAAVVVAAGMWTFGCHVLSLLGRFGLGEGLAGVALLAAGSHVLLRRAGRSWKEVFRRFGRDLRLPRRLFQPGRVSAISALRWLLIAFAAGALVRAALLPPLGWDTLTSHAVKAALWVRNGGAFDFDAPAGWNISRHYFAGAEIFQAWAMLPFHGDFAVGLVDWVEWVFLGFAVYGLGRELGLRARHAAAASAYVLFIPTVFVAVGSGYSELASNGALVAGVLFAFRWFRSADRGFLFLSVVALGLAGGMKITMPPVLAVVVALLVFDSFRAFPGRAGRLRVLLGGSIVAAAAISPWVVDNLRSTGYPLAFTPFRIFGVDLGVANRALAWYVDHPELKGFVATREIAALRSVFLPPWSHGTHLGALTLLPLALFVPGLVALARRRPRVAFLVAAISAVVLASYFQSGFTVVRLKWAAMSGRFLLPVVELALPIGFLALHGRRRWGDRYAVFLLVAAAIHAARQVLFEVARFEWPLLVGGVLLVAAGVLAGREIFRRFSFVRTPAGAMIALALAAVAGAALLDPIRTKIRYRAARESIVFHRIPRDWVPAAEAVDDPVVHRTIAVTAGVVQDADNWFLFPFFGRRLQNRLVYVPPTKDGRVVEFGPDGELAREADAEAWIGRLAVEEVSEVMSFRPASIELAWMASRPAQFERLAGDGVEWGLYRRLSRNLSSSSSVPAALATSSRANQPAPLDRESREANRR